MQIAIMDATNSRNWADGDLNEWAQTREPDNLFDDDFTPIAQPVESPPTPHAPLPQAAQPRPRGGNFNRGRNRGNGPRVNQRSQPSQTEPTDSPSAAEPATQPVDEKPKPVPAARGNRLPTGGVQKPKLTEDELTARLEAARLNNARREEAHRLAEADEASFLQREAQAREKRREEGAARRAMEGEREKNRLRKLGARGGREWDEGKQEEDFSGQRGSNYRRGAHGGVASDRGARANGTEDALEENQFSSPPRTVFERARGRGRGRGRGGRGGRGRGDYSNDNRQNNNPNRNDWSKPPNFTDDDFPEIKSEKISTIENADLLKPSTSTGDKGSWADQVEVEDPKQEKGSAEKELKADSW